VLADPDSDEPRLVYADFLQQRDDLRGELIAVQLAAGSKRQAAREAELLKKLAKQLPKPPLGKYAFARGFPELWKVAADKFAKHAADVFATQPIRILDLSQGNVLDPTPDAALEAFDRPELARVRRLELRRLKFPVTKIGRVFGSKHLADLRELDLGTMPMSRTATDTLAAASFAKLELLRLAGVKIDAIFVAKLAEATFAPALRTLDLTKSTIDDDAVVALAARKELRSLETIDISDCKVRDRGIGALVASKLPLQRVIAKGVRMSAGMRKTFVRRFGS